MARPWTKVFAGTMLALSLLMVPLSTASAKPQPGQKAGGKPAAARGLKVYDYSRSQFMISLPSEWKTRNDVIMPVVAAPKDVLNTKHEMPQVKVWTNPAEERMTLKTFGDEMKKQYSSFWKVKSDITSKVGAHQRRIMIIDQQDDKGVKSTVMKLFVINNGRYFVVTCAADSQDFPKKQALFESVVASFKPL